jgi:hypothetical protein
MTHQIGDIMGYAPVEDFVDELWIYGHINSIDQIPQKDLLEVTGDATMEEFHQFHVASFKQGLFQYSFDNANRGSKIIEAYARGRGVFAGTYVDLTAEPTN